MKKNIIGLDQEKSTKLVNELNLLLANFQVYYQNVRGLHWNIKGKNFFELHVKFEELYTDAQEKVDMIAERILTLQGKPIHTFDDYISISSVVVAKDVSNYVKAANVIVNSLSEFIYVKIKKQNYTYLMLFLFELDNQLLVLDN